MCFVHSGGTSSVASADVVDTSPCARIAIRRQSQVAEPLRLGAHRRRTVHHRIERVDLFGRLQNCRRVNDGQWLERSCTTSMFENQAHTVVVDRLSNVRDAHPVHLRAGQPCTQPPHPALVLHRHQRRQMRVVPRRRRPRHHTSYHSGRRAGEQQIPRGCPDLERWDPDRYPGDIGEACGNTDPLRDSHGHLAGTQRDSVSVRQQSFEGATETHPVRMKSPGVPHGREAAKRQTQQVRRYSAEFGESAVVSAPRISTASREI